MTTTWVRRLLTGLIAIILICPLTVLAYTNSKALDEAVKRYYDGHPEEAISMIEPLAAGGDVHAQYLLGNILYSLSGTGLYPDLDDPVKWYEMAAAQNFVDAIYALGALYHNRWIESRDPNDAASAIVNYQKASDLGSPKAHQPLHRLQFRSEMTLAQAEERVEKQQAMPALKLEPVAIIATEATPEPAVEPEPAPAVEPEPVSTAAAEPVVEPEPTKEAAAAESKVEEPAKETTESRAVAEADSALSVTLVEIADSCRTYTETGFNLYVDSITGALLSGTASVEAVEADASGAYSITLANRSADLTVFIEMSGVPHATAQKSKPGETAPINGNIVGSRVIGSDCSVAIAYQSAS